MSNRPCDRCPSAFCICEIVQWVSLDVCGSMKGLSRLRNKVCMQLWGFWEALFCFFLKPQSGRPLLCCGMQDMVGVPSWCFMLYGYFLRAREEHLSSLIPLYLSDMMW